MTTNLAQAYWKCVKEAEERANAEGRERRHWERGLRRRFSSLAIERMFARYIDHINIRLGAARGVSAARADFYCPSFYLMEIDIDLFEEMLEIVGYITYYSPQISQEMWQVWPKMLAVLDNGWALQYFEHV